MASAEAEEKGVLHGRHPGSVLPGVDDGTIDDTLLLGADLVAWAQIHGYERCAHTCTCKGMHVLTYLLCRMPFVSGTLSIGNMILMSSMDMTCPSVPNPATASP